MEKTLESPLDCKEIQPILKEISPEIFIGRTDAGEGTFSCTLGRAIWSHISPFFTSFPKVGVRLLGAPTTSDGVLG